MANDTGQLKSRTRDLTVIALFAGVLIVLNVLIIGRMFSVQHSAYLEANEGTFIALARNIAAHPGDLTWWPLWECGLPFQNTYLPLLPLLVGWFSRLTGHPPALSFYQVSAGLYCLGPPLLYLMTRAMTGANVPSFLAGFAYSVLSPCVWLAPAIRGDVGSGFHLRRLHTLAYYGEGPLTASMAVLPLAIWCLYRSVPDRRSGWWVGAGIVSAAVTISFNAFGAVILVIVALSLIGTAPRQNVPRVSMTLLMTGALAYALISPLIPPSVIAAIRTNSPTVDGDYRFTLRSLAGVAVIGSGFLLVRFITRTIRSQPLRFSAMFAFLTSSVVLLGTNAKIYVVPQPHRYQLPMDMACCLLIVLGGTELFRSRPELARPIVVLTGVLLLFGLAVNIRWAHHLIRSIDITGTSSYRITRWLDQKMKGQRVMVAGSYSFQFNEFSDLPQMFGGHDPMLPNSLMRVAAFTIYTGTNAGERDGQISSLWMKALGAHAVTVPGPHSSEVYKPFANPRKFDGLLPVLWRDGDDTIYGIPARSSSLAHVIPATAAVSHQPVNGLDVAELEGYVKALDDPVYAEAPLTWKNRHTAQILTTAVPGQIIAVQMTYHPGWTAIVNGKAQRVMKDGLGMILIDPQCEGTCNIDLAYGPDTEMLVTYAASVVALILTCLVVRIA